MKKFNSRIAFIAHKVVGLKTKLNLWSTYIRCVFDYFGPALAICGHIPKVEASFTKSIKLALGLPLQASNTSVLYVAGIPSIAQIAAHHIRANKEKILLRYDRCPDSLTRIAESLTLEANRYDKIIGGQSIIWEKDSKVLRVDLLRLPECFTKATVGLATGNYLSIRHKKGPLTGQMESCPVCKVPATQEHFVNNCVLNEMPRLVVKMSLPKALKIALVEDGDLNRLYTTARTIEITCNYEGVVSDDGFPTEETVDLLNNFGNALSSAANLITEKTLATFSQEEPEK